MQNLLISFNVVFPIFIMMFLGFFLKEKNFLSEKTLDELNKVTFRFFLSSMLFLNIYNIGSLDFLCRENLPFILFPIPIILASIFISWLLFVKVAPTQKQLSVMIQGAFRSNFIIYGITIVGALHGNEGVSIVSTLPFIVIPLYNSFAVIILEYYRGEKVNRMRIVKSTIKNPLILASILAIILLKLNITLPNIVHKSISDLAKITTPIAFIILGASLKFESLKNNFKLIMYTNTLRLIVFPLFAILIAHSLGFGKLQIASYLAVFATPTAVSSFTMAKEMNADYDLAAEIVVSTSIFSILTLFIWIFILKTLAWI